MNAFEFSDASAEFFAQIADVIVDAAIEKPHGTPQSGFGNFLAREDATCRTNEQKKYVELGAGQGDLGVIANDPALPAIDLEIANVEDFLRWRSALAAQDGAHAGHEFARIKGLWQVIVSAAFETRNAVGFIAACGEHNYRDLRSEANAPKDFAAVSGGQHDVEDDQFVFSIEGLPDAGISIVDSLDAETVHAEKTFERGAELDVIIDEKNWDGFHIRGAVRRFLLRTHDELVWMPPEAKGRSPRNPSFQFLAHPGDKNVWKCPIFERGQ